VTGGDTYHYTTEDVFKLATNHNDSRAAAFDNDNYKV
jgi:hypothetical protein